MVGPIISLHIIGNVFNALRHFLLHIQWLTRCGKVDDHNDSCPFNCWVLNLTYNKSFIVLTYLISCELFNEPRVFRPHRN